MIIGIFLMHLYHVFFLFLLPLFSLVLALPFTGIRSLRHFPGRDETLGPFFSPLLFCVVCYRFPRCGARAARVRSCRTAMNAAAFISFLIHAAKQA